MLPRLIEMFVGKKVVIITNTTSEYTHKQIGTCLAIHPVNGYPEVFHMELDIPGAWQSFVPENLTDNSAEGPFNSLAGGRRKIIIF